MKALWSDLIVALSLKPIRAPSLLLFVWSSKAFIAIVGIERKLARIGRIFVKKQMLQMTNAQFKRAENRSSLSPTYITSFDAIACVVIAILNICIVALRESTMLPVDNGT